MTPRSCWLLCVLLLAFCPTAAQAAQAHPRHHDHQEWTEDDSGDTGDEESDYAGSGDSEDWYVDDDDEYGDDYADEYSDDYPDEADDSGDEAPFDDGEPAQAPAPIVGIPELPRIPTLPVQPTMVHLHANGKVWVSPKVPRVVRRVIAAANRIAKRPYRYGGGHGSFLDRAYDCSGSVSYALHGAGLLNSTLVSGSLARWGAKGKGKWITIYANNGHVYMVIAGMRFDTSARARTGTRWDPWMRPARGFSVRHPPGL